MPITISCLFFCRAAYSQNNETRTHIDSNKYALLNIYRSNNIYSKGSNFMVYIGDTSFNVENNSKFSIKIYKEGEIRLWAKYITKREVLIHIKLSETYYVRCETYFGKLFMGPVFRVVELEKGKHEFDGIKKNQ